MRAMRFAIAALMLAVTAGQAQAAFVYNFTNAGATGANGPTQAAINSAYSATSLNGTVTSVGGIQEWMVQYTGVYLITAAGAQGASGDTRYVGGKGALISGEFFLTAGQILQIAVGQMGLGQSSGSNGGGGGGSFVVDALDNPLLVAGGGGGTRTEVSQNGVGGQTSQYATIGSGSSTTNPGTLKVVGLGLGGTISATSWGSAGAGFNSNGAGEYSITAGGRSWFNGLTGGIGISPQHGGFGGGGSGAGGWGGGGGGGYSGGDGGRVAGGGGSFNNGTNQTGIAAYNAGHGYVTIELLSPVGPVVPEPTSIALAGFAGIGMAVGAWRRRRQEKQAA